MSKRKAKALFVAAAAVLAFAPFFLQAAPIAIM